MTQAELNYLVEDLITIRDKYKCYMDRQELNSIAIACNVIYHSIDDIAED